MELEQLYGELVLIEEQLENKAIAHSDRQLLNQAWDDVNKAIEELLQESQPLEIAPPPPSCEGCRENQPNQLAHTGPGGCLEDKYPDYPEELNEIVDDRSCEKCAGCSNCANAEASYDGTDEI